MGRFQETKQEYKNSKKQMTLSISEWTRQNLFSTWYRDSKDLPRRVASERTLLNKAFKIAIHPRNNGYQCLLPSVVYSLYHKKSRDTTTHIVAGIIFEDQQLASDLHMLMQLRNKYNKGVRFLLCVTDIWQ